MSSSTGWRPACKRGSTPRPSSVRAYLRIPGHVVTFTRNWSQVVVDGKPVVLDAPVRVKAGIWLVPETFVSRVLPRMSQAASPAALPKTAMQAVALDELRVRSYPSFTRLVLETSHAVTYRVEPSGPREARVRVDRAAESIPASRRSATAWSPTCGSSARAAMSCCAWSSRATSGEVKALTLLDPHRLVLDFLRPSRRDHHASASRPRPLRSIVLDAGHGGQDTGAIGPSGLTEKELVLDVTRRVAKLVEEQLKIKVLLTRDDDNFVHPARPHDAGQQRPRRPLRLDPRQRPPASRSRAWRRTSSPRRPPTTPRARWPRWRTA